MEKTALITGASSGIGYELAKVFAKQGYQLILVARSEKKLEGLKADLEKQLGSKVMLVIKDLSEKNAAQDVYDRVCEAKHSVDVLVNNAGFGDYGNYSENDWKKQEEMVQVNIIALMQLTKLFLPQMLQSRSGKILNMASIASFQAGPYMSVYYASKAFVLSFSEALSVELKGSGITVTAICPGPTKTGFEDAAGAGASKIFHTVKNATAEGVALFSYNALMRGKPVAVHGFRNRSAIFATRFLPRSAVRMIVSKIQETRRK